MSDVRAATLQSTRFKRAAEVAPHNKKRMKDIPLTDNRLLGAPMTEREAKRIIKFEVGK